MAKRSGKEEFIDLNLPIIVRRRRKTFFLNDDLVRIYHVNRAAGMVTLDNLTKEYQMTIPLIEFRKKRRRAYTLTETAKLLNFHTKSIPRLIKQEKIPPPMGELPGGERAFHYNSYYSEDHIMDIRNIMSRVHKGKPRKDGLVTNNRIPTEQELRYAMGDGIMMYVKNDDGRFVPVFSETL
jgi:hypothetical protein